MPNSWKKRANKKITSRHERAGGSRHHRTMHGNSSRRDCSMCGNMWKIVPPLRAIKEDIREEVVLYSEFRYITDYIFQELYMSMPSEGESYEYSAAIATNTERRSFTLGQYLEEYDIKKRSVTTGSEAAQTCSDSVSVISDAICSDMSSSWDVISPSADDSSCFSDFSIAN